MDGTIQYKDKYNIIFNDSNIINLDGHKNLKSLIIYAGMYEPNLENCKIYLRDCSKLELISCYNHPTIFLNKNNSLKIYITNSITDIKELPFSLEYLTINYDKINMDLSFFNYLFHQMNLGSLKLKNVQN